ncbi:CoB--CoM heterodisulfide reductase iron-sulfur subunit B family protein [Candidatus Bathyarchaeota archaeon]|nr:CoB--CoM heterodisulfide reductase iron-sulfur subunit B family protein [Candidatus Bathyarchaeota archaeon]
MLKIPYYPGCAVQSTARNYAVSGIAVAKKLGIELVELPKWNCCGVFPYLAKDDLMRHLAPIRNLIHVQEMNEQGIVENEYRVTTFCSMCYHTLKEANMFLKEDEERLKKINIFLEREKECAGGIKEGYNGGVEVLDFLEVLRDIVGYDKIAENVEKPLTGLKVAPYYGCLVLRPRDIGIDDPESPSVMEKILEALGAEVVENPNKSQCCGSYHTVNRKDIVAKLTYENLIYPQRNGAEIVTTCCPLCTFNLDYRQKEAKTLHPDLKPIPIMYYTQLMAIAFGLDREYYGLDLDLHYIDPRPLLEAKGFLKK